MLAGLVAAVDPAAAADHLDAPGLTSPDGINELDINDVYVFEGRPGHTVLAMTVAPAATADTDFATGTRTGYSFRVDLDGDAVEDRTYHVRSLFKTRPGQFTLVQEANGRAAQSLRPRGKLQGFGLTDRSFRIADGGRVFAGLRSDPFFFDLSGFLGTVEGQGDDMLGQDPTDFFADLNTLAIVIEIPDDELNDGGPIGVWGTTSRLDGRKWVQVDRMGRPAINTVLNSSGPIVGAPSEAKNLFNDGQPVNDPRDFRDGAISALQAYSSLDVEQAYSDEQAGALADVLLPDILTFDKTGTLPPPLNGRPLDADVIDTELRIVTGGDPLDLFEGRDADGAINSDGVGPHDDYLTMFPYLGKPHR
jgi:hypothetical protein